MLNHEDPTSASAPSVGQQRITPQELTDALAVIDARRQEEARKRDEEARYLASTLPVGEAVSDLHLDATAEEIWDEVQAQRAAREPVEAAPAVTPVEDYISPRAATLSDTPFRGPVGAVVGAGVILMLLVGLFTFRASPPMIRTGPLLLPHVYNSYSQGMPAFAAGRRRASWQLDEEFYNNLQNTLGPHPTMEVAVLPISARLDNDQWQGKPTYPINAIPDGYVIHGSQYSFFSHSSFAVSLVAFLPVGTSSTQADAQDIYVRYNGKYYIRGFINTSDRPLVMAHQGFKLYNNAQSQDTLTPINLLPSPHSMLNVGLSMQGGNSAGTYIPAKQYAGEDSYTWNDQPPTLAPAHRLTEITQSFVQNGFDASSVIRPLAMFPNDVPFTGTGHLLHTDFRFLQTTTMAQEIDTRPGLNKPWAYIKHNGILYVRGWLPARLPSSPPQDSITGNDFMLCSVSHSRAFGINPVSLTLRVDKVHCEGITGAGTEERVMLDNVQLDSHAYEKWTP